jgi:hypothetical protein
MSRLVSVVQSPPFGHVAQGSGHTVETHDVSGVGVDAFGETRSGSDPPSEETDRAQDAWSVSVIADVARTRAARRRGFIGGRRAVCKTRADPGGAISGLALPRPPPAR